MCGLEMMFGIISICSCWSHLFLQQILRALQSEPASWVCNCVVTQPPSQKDPTFGLMFFFQHLKILIDKRTCIFILHWTLEIRQVLLIIASSVCSNGATVLNKTDMVLALGAYWKAYS